MSAEAGVKAVPSAVCSDGESEPRTRSKQNDKAGDSLRDASPDLSSGKEGRGGASRRKPKVTRKVVDTDDDAMCSDESASKEHKKTNGVAKESTKSRKEDLEVDDEGNPILPEGTVVVQPEAVEEKRLKFKGPEFSSRKRQLGDEQLDAIHCTACNKQINHHLPNSVKKHPVLKVLICKKCYGWYTSDEIDRDSGGMDEQCRWCGDGGNLFCCDYCHNAFCKSCIKRNLGRKEFSKLNDAGDDDKWHCYVCDAVPLKKLQDDCESIMEAVENATKKKKEQREKHEERRRDRIQVEKGKGKAGGKGGTPKSSARNTTMPNIQQMPAVTQQLMQQFSNNSMQKIVLQQSPVSAGTLILLPKRPQAQSTPSKIIYAQSPSGPDAEKQRFNITENNVDAILHKSIAAVESVYKLLKSFESDLKPTLTENLSVEKVSKLKNDVSKKVKRTLDAHIRTCTSLGEYSNNTATKAVSIVKKPAAEPSMSGLDFGAPINESDLSSTIGKRLVISKETLPNDIQLVTLSDSTVLAVKITNNKEKKSAAEEVIEVDSSEEEDKDSPVKKKPYKPGPKCSKKNRPGPKCSKANASSDAEDVKPSIRISFSSKSKENSKSEVENKSDDASSDVADNDATEKDTTKTKKKKVPTATLR